MANSEKKLQFLCRTREGLDLFDYDDPITYLNAVIDEKKSKNPLFSLRSWARSLGYLQPTSLSQILRRKRSISNKHIELFANNLEMDRQHQRYFAAIVEASIARTAERRMFWQKCAQSISLKKSYQMNWLKDYQLYQNSLPLVLLHLVNLKGFTETAGWIQRKLNKPVESAQIHSAIQLLLKLGLLQRGTAGELIRVKGNFSSPHDVASIWIKKFHESGLRDAADAIYLQAPENREYGSYLLAIKKEDLSKIKKSLRSYTEKLLAQYSVGREEADAVYQFNVNFFARTNLLGDH